MSIDEIDIVDFIGINIGGAVELTISDHLPWDAEHLLLLQDKINTYLSFYESGEIYQSYPEASDKQVIIAIICKHSPSEEIEVLLNRFKSVVEKSGLSLVWRQLEE